jgi:hypothetical protein
MIPGRTSKPTLISIETNNVPEGPLPNLPKQPPRVYNQEDQGKDPESKGDVPIDKCTIHLLSSPLSGHFPLYFFSLLSTQNSEPSRASQVFPLSIFETCLSL